MVLERPERRGNQAECGRVLGAADRVLRDVDVQPRVLLRGRGQRH